MTINSGNAKSLALKAGWTYQDANTLENTLLMGDIKNVQPQGRK